MNILILGPQGSGKGTQAQRIAASYGVPHIATGDMLREHVKENTELGKEAKEHMSGGGLVPDDLVIEMISERVDAEDAKDGFILDGFPRNVAQADALAEMLDSHGRRLTAVLLIDASDAEVIRRLGGRRVCVKAGHTYHVEFDPPKREGVCDQDGSRLEQREDDKEETIRKRLEVYHETTEPLIEFYEEKGVLRRFDGARNPTEVHDHIRAVLATLRLEERL